MVRKSRRIIEDEKAQAAIFDAIMFFIIMLVASSFVFIYSTQAFQTQEVIGREDMGRYTEETREAILQSSVPEAWYFDINDNKVEKPPASTNINDLLMDELSLLDDGVPRDNFHEGYESQIYLTIKNMVRAGYGFELLASYTNGTSGETYSIYISSGDTVPKEDVTTSQWESSMSMWGKPGFALIKLSIWRP